MRVLALNFESINQSKNLIVFSEVGYNKRLIINFMCSFYFYLSTKITHGLHSNASGFVNRIGFTSPFFNMEMIAVVVPGISTNSFYCIFLLARITSKLTIMEIIN